MVIAVTMRALHNHLVLHGARIFCIDLLRHIERAKACIRVHHAGSRRKADRTRSARGDYRAFTMKPLGKVLARLDLQVVQTHRMQSRLLYSSKHLRRHACGGQRGVGARGVDDLGHAELCVVIFTVRSRPGR